MLSSTEAFELLAYGAQLLGRLDLAVTELAQEAGLKAEKQWLEAARRRVSESIDGLESLRERALRLPELESLREDQATSLQALWVDALERLQAGITFHAGSRAPILEALFPKQKLAAVRKATVENADQYAAQFEKRLNGSYVKRMLADPTFVFAGPVIEQIRAAHQRWKSTLQPEPMSEADAEALRSELGAAAEKLSLPLRQARLLAEAALAPLPEAFERSGLAAKPRRKSYRSEPRTEPEAQSGGTELEGAEEVESDVPAAGEPTVPRARRSSPEARG